MIISILKRNNNKNNNKNEKCLWSKKKLKVPIYIYKYISQEER